VPGGIILTDIWLYLNQMLDQKLFVRPNLSKEIQAGKEADRCKKLIGALRYLYRNSVWALLLQSSLFFSFFGPFFPWDG
jgi:hypothetical protein